MDIDDILILINYVSEDGIHGKTAIQKIAYFVSVTLQKNMGFYAHYYGPYSKEVDINLKMLRNFSFITQNLVPTKFKKLMPIFKLTADGREIATSLKDVYKDDYAAIKKIVELCTTDSVDYNVLSYAAKVHYAIPSEKKVTNKQIMELADKYDWDLSHDDVEVAKRLLVSLGFVKLHNKQ